MKICMKGAAWDSVFLAVTKLMTTLAAIAQTKILSTGLSLNTYGTYSQVSIVVALCASLTMMGFGDGINYFFNGRGSGDKGRRYVDTIFALEMLAGIACAGALVLFRNVFSDYFSNEALSTLLIVVSLKPLLENLLYMYQVLFVSLGKARWIAVRNFILSLVKVCVTGICVYLVKNIAVLLAVMLGLDGIQYIIMRRMFGKCKSPVRLRNAKAGEIAHVFAYCLPMGVFALTNLLTREVDKLVVGRLAGTEALAIYANCSKLLPFDIIVGSFTTVLIPYIMRYVSSGRHDQAVHLFRNYLKIGYYTVWTMGTAVLIVHRQAIAFLYSDAFLPGRTVFVLYVLDSMMRFVGMHLILTAGGYTKYLMTCSMLSLAANTLLNVLMYRIVGIEGPAIATLTTAAGYMLAVVRKDLSVLKAGWHEIADFGKLRTFVAGLILTGTAFSLLNQGLLKSGIHEVLAMFIVMGGFTAVNFIIQRKNIVSAFREINGLKM